MKLYKFKNVAIVSFLVLMLITYAYGKKWTYVYGGVELIISAICYYSFINNYRLLDSKIKKICAYLIIVAFIVGIFNFNPKSTLLITTPLIIPMSICLLDIDYSCIRRQIAIASITISAFIFIFDRVGLFRSFNSNTIGFLTFMGASFCFLWVEEERAMKKIIPVVFVLFTLMTAALSGSRNVSIVGLLCIVLILIPQKVFNNKYFFWILCGSILVYTVFSASIMDLGFSNSKISEFLNTFTIKYSKKAWSMESRSDYLFRIKNIINNRSFLTNIFGSGVLQLHGHNMFYQCVAEFGYLGTFFIYLMFIRIFYIAHFLISEKNDRVALGCTVALLGNLLLQGADVYLLGPEAYAVVPQVLMGIILNRYRCAIWKSEGWIIDENNRKSVYLG